MTPVRGLASSLGAGATARRVKVVKVSWLCATVCRDQADSHSCKTCLSA